MQTYLGKRGDSYDRFLIRIREMYESVNIIFQILNKLSSHASNDKSSHFFKFLNYETYQKLNHNTKYNSMETLINHFKNYSEGLRVPRGFTYNAIEAPKGEFGVTLISDNTSTPYRCKIRTPAYHHIQVMPRLVQGHFFADLVTVLGSQDIVFGDVDR
jgi:NADH-quinone oxidoreductase subunit D